MSEIIQKSIVALADSPLTTKAVMAVGASSLADRVIDIMPDLISMAGAIIAGLAGYYLYLKHKKAGKLHDARREGVEMQNAHDAKIQALELEKLQIELGRYKADDA